MSYCFRREPNRVIILHIFYTNPNTNRTYVSNDSTTTNYLLVVGFVLALLVLYPVVQALVGGEPPEVWVADVVVGVSCIITVLAVWWAADDPEMEHFRQSDWFFVLLCVSWIALGVGLYLSRYATRAPGGELIFAFFGAVGAAGMGYKFVSVRSDKL